MLSKIEAIKKLFAVRDALECDSQENIVEIEKIDEVIRFILEIDIPRRETFTPVPYPVPYPVPSLPQYPPYGYPPTKIWLSDRTMPAPTPQW